MSTQKLRIWRSSRECYVFRGLWGGCWNFVMRNCTLWRFIFSTATWTAARKSHHIALHCQFGVELTMNYEFGEVFIDFGTFLPLFSLFFFFWLMYVRGWGFLFSCSPSNMCRMFFWRFCCADWRRGEKGAKKREWNFLVFVGLIIIVCDTQSRFFSLIPFLRLSWKFLLTLNNVVSVSFRFFNSFLPSSCATTMDFDFRSRVLAASTAQWKVEMNMRIGGIFSWK